MQARYDLNMTAYGVPGLNLMARYIKGDIDGASVDTGGAYAYYAGDAGKGKEWERDLEAKYVVQEGDLKDLSLRVRYATARGFAGDGGAASEREDARDRTVPGISGALNR